MGKGAEVIFLFKELQLVKETGEFTSFRFLVFIHICNVFEFDSPQSSTEFHRDYFLLISYKQEIETL